MNWRVIAAGRSDIPLIELRWRCGPCGSRLTDTGLVEVQAAEFGVPVEWVDRPPPTPN
jgi:hypothetical protein